MVSIGTPMVANWTGTAATAEPTRVERRRAISDTEFRSQYLHPRRPVILEGAAAAWPILRHGSPDDFRRAFADHPVRLLGASLRLSELLDVLERSTPERPAPYPCKYEIAKDFRELLDGVTPRLACSLPDRQENPLLPRALFDGVNNLEIFFGGPGGRFPYLHYDVMHLHAWITQLHGDKEFTLYSPKQEEFLYVNANVPWQSAIRNHHNVDHAAYPLFRNARPLKVILRAGETLFIPCGWWHTARSLTMTISVAFDQLGPDNWDDFVADAVATRRREGRAASALLLRAYLAAIGPILSLWERLGGGRSMRWGER